MLNVIIDQVGKNLEIRTAVPCHIEKLRMQTFGGNHRHACVFSFLTVTGSYLL